MPDEQTGINLSGAQIGDVSATGNAGGSIYHGANPAPMVDALVQSLASTQQFFREYVHAADQTREKAIKEAAQELRHTRDELRIYSDALGTVRDRLDDVVNERERDLVERRARQRVLNWWLAGITASIALLALAVSWLAWRELLPPIDPAALARLARLWLGGGLTIFFQLRRLV